MKKLQWIKRIDLTRLVVEAILIFASVYAAFLLEDRRSRNFERKVFRDKLQTHLKILRYDSINFESRLGSSDSYVNNGMKKSLDKQLYALDLLKSNVPDSMLKVYQMQKEEALFWWVIQSTIVSQQKFEELSSEYSHLIANDSTLHWMRLYIYHSFVLNKFATDTDQLLVDLENFGYENYFVLSDNDNEEDALEYVSQPYYYNTVSKHIQYLKTLKNFKSAYDRDYTKIKEAIEAENEAQEKQL